MNGPEYLILPSPYGMDNPVAFIWRDDFTYEELIEATTYYGLEEIQQLLSC
jgi:hypothetical protein